LAAAPAPLAADALLPAVLAGDRVVTGVGLAAAWELADAWVEPGRMAATAPAVTTPAMPTVTVTARRWPWLRCRANTAARTSDRRWFMKILGAQ
jgi:hypothetical protein